MPDLICHPLPFGGFALEPMTAEGRHYLEVDGPWPDFRNTDACMTGFASNVYGYEPQEEWVIEDALASGLTVEPPTLT